jgi:hypothetical protein
LYVGTFFASSRLPARTWLKLLYYFAVNNQQQQLLQHELHLSQQTIVVCKKKCRDFCVEYFNRNPIKIGGEGHKVEVDECLVSRRKYNRGHQVEERWIIGGVDQETGECFFEQLISRDAAHITAAITNYVLPNTILVTDCWKGYNSDLLRNYGIAHMTVNHSMNYVDPQTKATTNHIESLWQKLKMVSGARFGLRTADLRGNIAEFVWRQRFGEKNVAMSNLLSQIPELYPPVL